MIDEKGIKFIHLKCDPNCPSPKDFHISAKDCEVLESWLESIETVIDRVKRRQEPEIFGSIISTWQPFESPKVKGHIENVKPFQTNVEAQIRQEPVRRFSLSRQALDGLSDGSIFEPLDWQTGCPKFSFVKPHGSHERRKGVEGVSSHRGISQEEIRRLEEKEQSDRLNMLKERLISKEDPTLVFDTHVVYIGKGGMGEVFVAKRSGTKEKVAIKKIKTITNGKDRLPYILNEIDVLSNSKHENIVNFIAAYQYNNELWVCMEYMEIGSLYDIVRFGFISDETIIAYLVKSVLKALKFIHDLKRIHRDVKVDNVLISKKGEVKLADFGAAVQLTFQRLKRNTVTGTPYYMSPEVIKGQQYDEKVDIWSLGILCVEVVERTPPFYDLATEEALDMIVQGKVQGIKRSKGCSDVFVHFVNECCLQYQPSKRWTAEELLSHPFIEKACRKDEFCGWIETIASFDSNPGCNIL